MREIKIGCLLPVSGIMPSMSKDFKQGLELAINEGNIDELKIEIVPELTSQGQIQNVSEAINKLVSYDGVDVLTGIVSSLAIKELRDTVNAKKIPFLYSNLGEFVPSKAIDSPFLFLNSLNLWQSQWAIGKWAQEKYGGTASICFSVYDAGYHLHEAFRLGAIAGGAKSTKVNLLPLLPNRVDTSPLIDLIKEQQPSHVHAILCGVDGKDFLKRYQEAGFLGKIPLTVCPFLVEDNLISEIENLVEDIPNSISWSYQLKNTENERFIYAYEKYYMRKPSVFSVLGYESGLLLFRALKTKIEKGVALENTLPLLSIESPRGEIKLNISPAKNVYLRKPMQNGGTSPLNFVTDEIASVDEQHPDMVELAQNGISGWQNPYLCI